MNRRTKIEAIIIILVIVPIGSIYLFIQYGPNGTANLTITSVNAKPGFRGMPNSYALNISLKLSINGKIHLDYPVSLSVCTFSIQVNSSIWKAYNLVCSGIPPGSEIFYGSYNFGLNLGMTLINSTETPLNSIAIPFNVSISAFSGYFNVVSPYYTVQINS